jgi:hypothetical protein
MKQREIKWAIKNARKALKQLDMAPNKTNIMKILVDYYGFDMRQVEDIKI